MRTGKLPESMLGRSVLKQVHTVNHRISHPFSEMVLKQTKGAAVGSDCAFFAAPNGQILAWCAQEAAVAGKADAGEAAALVQKCANNLAAAGATPVSAMITIMLPEECEESDVKELMGQIVKACEALQMEVAGGDANVTFAVKCPIVTITAIGAANPKAYCDLSKAKAGQDLVLTKWIGLDGTAILAREHREKLLKRYPAYLVDEAAGFAQYLSVVEDAKIALEAGACAMHDLSQGGVFGALWELAEGAGLGLDVDLKKIPIRQETVETCEVCGVNPYEMKSGGSLLIAATDGEAVANALEAKGISAAVIGKLTESGDRVVRNGEETRFLDRPKGADLIYETGNTEN